MALHPQAGQLPVHDQLVNVPRLITAYYARQPNPEDPGQRVSFGTSGHRGSSLKSSFNERHILAITQAIVEHRAQHKITGPLYLGMDTHALSEPALVSALEVLAANGTEVVLAADGAYSPTPVISRAIIRYNQGRESGLADGIVITPSHNPPEDGGFKYNPPHGGPAGSEITGAIERAANVLLERKLQGVKALPYERALAASTTRTEDLITPYVEGLSQIIDFEVIKSAGLKIGADPMGGSGIACWAPIAERYGLSIDVVNPKIDPTFRFMTLDKDGKIRMDCSSPSAMAGLIALKERYDIAFGNDTDYDRHGIVTKSVGLMNPNHYLAVAIDYLFSHRPQWSQKSIGKTLVSSSMIDRVASALSTPLVEVPVGFKWFVQGLQSGSLGFGGEESAGASFLTKAGQVWTTDKDGIILALLAAEICARTEKDPGERYQGLVQKFGEPVYERLDAPATRAQKALLKKLSPEQVTTDTLAGEPIVAKLTEAPGNRAAIGGLKVVAENGWFAARPSGTEDVYKIYTESFLGPDHLAKIQGEAQAIVSGVFEQAEP